MEFATGSTSSSPSPSSSAASTDFFRGGGTGALRERASSRRRLRRWIGARFAATENSSRPGVDTLTWADSLLTL